MSVYISLEYENENYWLLMFSDSEFNLLDLKNGTFKTLDVMWHTTLEDIILFLIENTNNLFVGNYICKLLETIDDEEDRVMLNEYANKLAKNVAIDILGE